MLRGARTQSSESPGNQSQLAWDWLPARRAPERGGAAGEALRGDERAPGSGPCVRQCDVIMASAGISGRGHRREVVLESCGFGRFSKPYEGARGTVCVVCVCVNLVSCVSARTRGHSDR